MASSGLWENTILTKTNLPQMEPIYVQQTLVPEGGKPVPQWRTILTNVKNVSVYPIYQPPHPAHLENPKGDTLVSLGPNNTLIKSVIGNPPTRTKASQGQQP